MDSFFNSLFIIHLIYSKSNSKSKSESNIQDDSILRYIY